MMAEAKANEVIRVASDVAAGDTVDEAQKRARTASFTTIEYITSKQFECYADATTAAVKCTPEQSDVYDTYVSDLSVDAQEFQSRVVPAAWSDEFPYTGMVCPPPVGYVKVNGLAGIQWVACHIVQMNDGTEALCFW